MVIDQEKLIALLVEETGESREKVSRQLSRLSAQVRAVTDAGEPFEIKHFGVFSVREGELHFEPSEQFKTEINQKYAGMQPIELMAAHKESGAGVPVEETPASQEMAGKSEPGPDERSPKEQEAQPEKESPDQPEKTPEKVPVSASAAAPVKEKTDEEAPDEEPVHPSFRDRSSNGGRLGKLLVAVVAGIVILAGGWLVYSSGVLQPGKGERGVAPADTAAPTTVGQNPVTATTDSAQNEQPNTDSTEQNATGIVSNDSVTDSNAVSSKYGLKGTVNTGIDGAFTIVIHSFKLKSTIQPIADSLHEQGYRTLLLERPNSKVARWRLGLGQFKTRRDAREAARKLPVPYKEHHFIARI